MRRDRFIGLFVMEKKGLAVLKHLTNSLGPEAIGYVVSAPDSGLESSSDREIEEFCRAHAIPHWPRGMQPALETTSLIFAVGWKWMLPVTEQLVIFHDSLLPRYRGFAPLVSALINEERSVGVTALKASDRYDEGDIILQRSCDLGAGSIRIAEAIEKVIPLYCELAEKIATTVRRGTTLIAKPQDHSLATYSLWRDEEDYLIDWTWDSAAIKRKVYATGLPYAGASTYLDGRLIRVLDVEQFTDVTIENRTPGKTIFTVGDCPVVVCSSGLIKITRAIDNETRESVLPMQRFRSRFRQRQTNRESFLQPIKSPRTAAYLSSIADPL